MFSFFARTAGDYDDVFPFDIGGRILAGKIGERSAIDPFVEFCEFCADGGGTGSAECLGGGGERLANTIGRFVKHQGVRR